MFSSLEDQIKRDDASASSPRERWIRYASAALVSLLVFGGLWASILMLE